MAIYGLDQPQIIAALIRAKERGIAVALKADKVQSADRSQKKQLPSYQVE